MSFKKVKIKELVTLINGHAFKPEDWGVEGKRIIRIQNLNNPEASYNFTKKEVAEKYIVRKGDILIAWAGSLGVYEWDQEENALLNQHLFKVDFNTTDIEKSYFRYVIYQALVELEQKARGVGLKHLKKGQIDNYEFQLPPMPQQLQAVSLLRNVESIIAKRKSTISLIEEYYKSFFISMFGDPIVNPKQWETNFLENLTLLISDGTHKTPKYSDSGKPFLSAKDISNNQIDWENTKYITQEEYEYLLSRGVPQSGDILLTKSGSLGRTSILEKDIEFGFYESIALIRCDNELNPYFLLGLFQSDAIQFILNERKKGVAIKHLHLKTLKNLNIILPPVNLQDKFEHEFKRIQSTKYNLQASLSLLEELRQGLIFETFSDVSEKQLDRIDELIEDDIQLELFLNTIKSSDFESEELYTQAIEDVFEILDRTQSRNQSNPKYLKGLIQRLNNKEIILETNKENKYRLSDEAATN